MTKDKFKSAIEFLKAENQAFVNKYGISSKSKQKDIIINDLIDFYKSKTKQQDLEEQLEKLILICKIYGIPLQEFSVFSLDFLKVQYNYLVYTETLFTPPFIYFLEINTNFLRFEITIEGIFLTLKSYINFNAMQCYLNSHLTFEAKEIAKNFTNDEELLTTISQLYYAGQLNPYSDETSHEKRFERNTTKAQFLPG